MLGCSNTSDSNTNILDLGDVDADGERYNAKTYTFMGKREEYLVRPQGSIRKGGDVSRREVDLIRLITRGSQEARLTTPTLRRAAPDLSRARMSLSCHYEKLQTVPLVEIYPLLQYEGGGWSSLIITTRPSKHTEHPARSVSRL